MCTRLKFTNIKNACVLILKWQITHCERGERLEQISQRRVGSTSTEKDCFVPPTRTVNSRMRTDNSTQGSQAKLINRSRPSRLRLLPWPCVSSYVLKIQKRDPAHDKKFVKIFEEITIPHLGTFLPGKMWVMTPGHSRMTNPGT